MLSTRNIFAYAQACNVELKAMLNHLQRDEIARKQFEQWKADTGR